MQNQFIAAINQICAEKNIPRDTIVDIIKSALATAYRKDYGNKDQEIEVILRDDQDNPTILLIKEVVAEVEDPNIEISLDEAKKIKKDVEEGDEIKIDVTPLKYGRIAAQAAKQVIMQRVQEQEREILFDMFKNREDEILIAQVSRVEGKNVYLSIDKNTVMLSPKERIPGEQYYTGKRICVYLDSVKRTTKGPQLFISRTHPNLIKKLLEKEIPEVASGEIQVKAIARDPGFRSKVAVFAEDEKLDPIGSCVGQKGVRIHAVMGEVNNERVDIIQWDPQAEKLIADALQPAVVNAIIIVNDEDYTDDEGKFIKRRAAIFLSKDERPIAIGKKGQNIRLASELTGYELDVYNYEELDAFKKKYKELTGEKQEEYIVTPFSPKQEGEKEEEGKGGEEAPAEGEEKAEATKEEKTEEKAESKTEEKEKGEEEKKEEASTEEKKDEEKEEKVEKETKEEEPKEEEKPTEEENKEEEPVEEEKKEEEESVEEEKKEEEAPAEEKSEEKDESK